jgi:hypothetical protein
MVPAGGCARIWFRHDSVRYRDEMFAFGHHEHHQQRHCKKALAAREENSGSGSGVDGGVAPFVVVPVGQEAQRRRAKLLPDQPWPRPQHTTPLT